jgi:hypothetical protein
MAESRDRGILLTVAALLFGVLALSNTTKAFQHLRAPETLGIVIFGVRAVSLAANLVLGPVMGLVLGLYSYGLWTLRPWVAPLSIAYAFYVPVNLVLFWYMQTQPEVPPLGFMLGYLAVSLTGSIGTALYLAYHRDKLSGS